MFQSDVAFIRSEEVVVCPLGEGLALLDTRSNRYFSLNTVGAEVWEALKEPRSAEQLAHTLSEAYGEPSERVMGDVVALMSDLDAEALITRADAGA